MTGDRRDIRARLAAALDDADAIESRPIEEVRTALAEQGIDASGSIRLAQRLARSGADDPAATLLSKIERSEAVDDEIAALEYADIDEIKAALAPDIAASGRASARQRPEDRSSSATAAPVEARRWRLSTLGWGGSLIGLAASVLLFIAIRPDRLEQVHAPSLPIEAPAPVAADAESGDPVSEEILPRAEAPPQNLLPELSQLQGRASTGRERYATGQADLADAQEKALAAGAGRQTLQSLGEKAAQPLAERRELAPREQTELDLSSGVTASKTEPRQSVALPAPRPDLTEDGSAETAAVAQRSEPPSTSSKAEPPRNPPRPVPRPDFEKGEGVETAVVTSRSEPRPTTAADVAGMQEPPPVPAVPLAIVADLKAMLLVDEASAPRSLRALSNRLPKGRLAAKLREAELRAADAKVIALIAFARDGEIAEAALVETSSAQTAPDPSRQTITGFTGVAEGEPAVLLGSEASFELIELSTSR